MKKVMLIAFIALFAGGCAGKSVKEITQNDRNFTIKTDDSRAEILISGMRTMTIDGVTVEPTRTIAAAIDKALPQISGRFTSPEEVVSSGRPKSEWASYMLSVFYTRDSAAKKISTTPIAVGDVKWWENAQHNKTYQSFTELKFNCTGDTPQACSKKLGDAAAEAVMPVVSKFVRDLGY
jgi:L,D-peptidoglycan transpeptidase YkuD (ErfK/YbiS/YcfS/YnhG family)